MILSGDIGGTKTHLAVYEETGHSLRPVVFSTYASRDYRTLIDVLRVMRQDHPLPITAAAFGVAGPIVAGKSRLTNLGWDVDGVAVAEFLGLRQVGLLNDLEAMAYGTLRLAPEHRVALQTGVPQEQRTIAVIAAGTGLGEGGLVWDGTQYRAVPTEGGHTDFGPRSELEIDMLRFLTAKFGRVSYERILSGPGLVNVYEFLRSRTTTPEPAWLRQSLSSGDPAAVISQAGLESTDAVCVQTLDMFVSLYGSEAGNLALKFLSTGGVFVGGGIAPKILPLLKRGTFMQSFVAKGRYSSLLEQMPVDVILDDRCALIGAAHYAAVMMKR
jgi:glucokinase